MKLKIEYWLEEQRPRPEVHMAFAESVVCYKAGAYRAALMLSYTGMGLWLCERLLDASRPAGFNEKRWDAALARLRDDNKRDDCVFDCTQQSNTPVFIVDDHLREEMKFWKNRRNDCAHFKRNEIGAAHVEAFWLYLQSNLGRWVPNGSRADLLQRLTSHFNPNLTAPGTPVAPLAAMIPNAVPLAERSEFFEELVQTLPGGLYDSPQAHTFNAILGGESTLAQTALTWLARNYVPLLCAVLRLSPHYVGALVAQPEVVRQLWRKHLFQSGRQDLVVFAAMVRSGIIPDLELPDAVRSAVERVNGDTPGTQEDYTSLERAGFWAAFRNRAFIEGYISNFAWANANAETIAWYVGFHPIELEVAKSILDTFDDPNHPYHLLASLQALFTANAERRQQLVDHASTLNREIPAVLKVAVSSNS